MEWYVGVSNREVHVQSAWMENNFQIFVQILELEALRAGPRNSTSAQ